MAKKERPPVTLRADEGRGKKVVYPRRDPTRIGVITEQVISGDKVLYTVVIKDGGEVVHTNKRSLSINSLSPKPKDKAGILLDTLIEEELDYYEKTLNSAVGHEHKR